MSIYLQQLVLAAVVVYIVDVSGFTESWRNAIARWLHVSELRALREIYISEVNRLYGTSYTVEDAFDADKSLAIFRALQAHYNPTKDIGKGIYYHNKSSQYRGRVMEVYEMVERYETIRAKLIEK